MIILITDSFLKLQKVNKVDYFLPQLSVLNSEMLHDFEVMWSEDKTISETAKDIKELILRSPTLVTIMAHGKGGLDALECLIQYPELQDKVEKLVTLQSPMWGTPIADFLTGHLLMGAVTRVACKFMGCSVSAIEEMSELNRQVYMIVNKEKIRSLLKNVSVVSVGSTFEMPFKPENIFERVMNRIHRLVSKYAGANDGLVPLQSTRISNEPHMQLENIPHMNMVTPSFVAGPEVENLTRNILKSVKPLKLAEYPAKFPWGQSEENTSSKPGRPYQLEIS